MQLEDFYKEILNKLKVKAPREPAHASDRLAAKEKYEQLFAEFERRDLITWFDDDDVPDWIANGFAAMVAFALTDTYAVPDEDYIKLRDAAARGETTLIGDGQRRQVPSENPEYY